MDKAALAADVRRMPKVSKESSERSQWLARPGWGALALSALVLVAVILVGLGLRNALPSPTVMLLMLAAVLLNAAMFGFWAGIASAIASFLAFNFLFIEPLMTLRVASPGDVLTLLIFLLVAATTGFIAGRMREETDAATSRAAMLEVLSDFSSQLADASTKKAVTELMLQHLSRATASAAVHFAAQDGNLELESTMPPGLAVEPQEVEAADRAWRRKGHEAAAAAGWSGSRFDFRPLNVAGEAIGVIGYASRPGHKKDLRYRQQAVAAIIRQGKVALERLGFADQAAIERAKAEIETVRASLLSSLSHDLRTPLATILGSVTSLRELDNRLTPAARADLLLAIEEETRRLSRYVDNLLNMTRLQAGVDLRLEWTDIADVVNAAVARARRSFVNRRIDLHMPRQMPVIRTDGVLLEQVLFNLVDNAIKFSPANRPVSVAVTTDGNSLQMSVLDDGSGISPADIPRLFDRFHPGTHELSSGAGLGLSICKAIVDALGGVLEVESPRKDHGAGTAVHVRLTAPSHQQAKP